MGQSRIVSACPLANGSHMYQTSRTRQILRLLVGWLPMPLKVSINPLGIHFNYHKV